MSEGQVACYDCGLPYAGDHWVEAVVSHDTWKQISPTGDEGGILCVSCMAARLAQRGLSNVPMKLTAGPFVLEPRIEALEAENFKLAAGACNVEGGLIGDDHGHFDCSLKARIEALEREQSWQPIETAPKDGTRLLATDGVNVTVVEWKVYYGRWEKLTGWNHLYGARWNGPVAWRPLPDAAIRNGERG